MKIAKLTLTPNRSTGPRRYVRLVCYRRSYNPSRDVDEVDPYLYQNVEGRETIDRLRFRDVNISPTDPEFAEDWAAHVGYQAALARDASVG